MKYKVQIHVTQKHIDQGTRTCIAPKGDVPDTDEDSEETLWAGLRDAGYSPVALAIEEAGYGGVLIGDKTFDFLKTDRRVKIPWRVNRWIDRFFAGKCVKPFSFTLKTNDPEALSLK